MDSNATESTSQRQGRAGRWQYPDLAPELGNGAQASDAAHGAQPGPARRAERELRLGSALGWFSIGIGLLSLAAPRAVARATGLPDWPLVLRAIGMREIVSGVGLLRRPDNQVWRWSRVAGDAMDLTVLGIAAAHPSANRARLASTALALASVSALDLRAGNPPRVKPSRQSLSGPQGGQRVRETIAINRTPAECYASWRDLARLPTFMQHLLSVEVIDERRSHWCAKGPAGRQIEWDADITDDQPGRLLAWRSVEGADVENAGSVRFAPGPGGKGTLLEVEMSYQPPAGRAGALVARLFGEEPSIQVRQDLRRFKQLMETGEIPTTKGQSEGKRSLKASLFRKGAES
ncbi:MAG: SRPBCC family protein [Pseudomonadota bacterium]